MNHRGWSRRATAMLIVVLTIVVAIGRSTPAAATVFSETHSMTYSTDYSYASAVDLCTFGTPCTLRVVAESDLKAGYSGSQICTSGGSVLYDTYVTSYPAVINQFDPYGDAYFSEYSPPLGDYEFGVGLNPIHVNDADADGSPGPKEDYTVTFNTMIYGRSMSITYSYGLAFPSGTCNSDGYSTSTTLQSRVAIEAVTA